MKVFAVKTYAGSERRIQKSLTKNDKISQNYAVAVWYNYRKGEIMARVIVVTSGKGGVGKTTVAVNLAYGLAKSGERSLIIDMDAGLNNADILLGVTEKGEYDLFDLVNGKCRLNQATQKVKNQPALSLLSSRSKNDYTMISSGGLERIIEEADSLYDYVFIDCPAGVGSGFCRSVAVARECIVVVNPNEASLSDAKKVVGILSTFDLDEKYLVINRFRGDMVVDGEMPTAKDIQDRIGLKLIGIIPEDDAVYLSTGNVGKMKGSQSSKAYAVLVENLTYGKADLFCATDRYEGFFGKIKRMIKRRV